MVVRNGNPSYDSCGGFRTPSLREPRSPNPNGQEGGRCRLPRYHNARGYMGGDGLGEGQRYPLLTCAWSISTFAATGPREKKKTVSDRHPWWGFKGSSNPSSLFWSKVTAI